MKLHANAALTPKQRLRMCRRVVKEDWSVSEAAAAAEVTERTCDKWVERYLAEGEDGLYDRSSAPQRVANRTPEDRIQAIARHMLRRDAHDALPTRDQEPLERSRHVPAVLERPDPLPIELARPHQQLAEAALARRRGQLPAGARRERVDRPAGVGLLVCVRPDHDHVHRPFDR